MVVHGHQISGYTLFVPLLSTFSTNYLVMCQGYKGGINMSTYMGDKLVDYINVRLHYTVLAHFRKGSTIIFNAMVYMYE